MTLCTYRNTGKIGGHWCNECPPLAEYFAIEKKEMAALAALNKKLREKSSKAKRVRN
jgi:hypothetical protein